MKKYLPVAFVAAFVLGANIPAVFGQSSNTSDPSSAPLASPTGGYPLPVDRAEAKRDNTMDPNSAPLASPTGGKPAPVDPAEVKRDKTSG